MKTFTLDEAQSLLPVLESLLKRAIEGKQSAEEVGSGLSDLARRIYLSGGMKVDVTSVARQRAEMEGHLQRVRETLSILSARCLLKRRRRMGNRRERFNVWF